MKYRNSGFKNTWREVCRHKYIYLMIFAYIPMGGLILAFKNYKAKLGIWGSPFVGLKHFMRLFEEADFWRAFTNTIQISLGRILFEFPFPIILAIFVGELKNGKFKKSVQTILTFPHFLSWVVVAAIVTNVFEYSGIINQILQLFGKEPITFLADKSLFRPLLYFTSIWKESGWTSIIYLSAIAAIDSSLYEAASIDGAGKLQRIWHITLPGIKSAIVVQLLLNIGRMMNGGFDQIFNMSNPAVQNVADILDTYIYRITFQTGCDFGFSTAVGLFKSVINFALLLIFDKVARKMGEQGIVGG